MQETFRGLSPFLLLLIVQMLKALYSWQILFSPTRDIFFSLLGSIVPKWPEVYQNCKLSHVHHNQSVCCLAHRNFKVCTKDSEGQFRMHHLALPSLQHGPRFRMEIFLELAWIQSHSKYLPNRALAIHPRNMPQGCIIMHRIRNKEKNNLMLSY